MLFNLFSRRKKLAAAVSHPAAEPESPAVAATSTSVESPVVPQREDTTAAASAPVAEVSTTESVPESAVEAPETKSLAPETESLAPEAHSLTPETETLPGEAETLSAETEASEVPIVESDGPAAPDSVELSDPTAAEQSVEEPAREETTGPTVTSAAEPTADPEPDELDLTSLTVPALRQRARDAGLTGYSRMKKSELIVALAATRHE